VTFGAPVAQQLPGDGFQVRLLVRNRGRVPALDSDFDYTYGDVDDSASLQVALAGCDAVHVSVRGGPTAEQFDRVEHRGTARVAELAAREGVQRISYVSHSLAASDASAPDLRAKRGRSVPLQESGERGDPTEANRLLSAPSITLAEWCERRLP
jgi:uncharacterized protein YbjT (DUF2867 family)